MRQGLTPAQPSFAPVADIYALLRSPDRFVRYSGRLALEHTPRAEWMQDGDGRDQRRRADRRAASRSPTPRPRRRRSPSSRRCSRSSLTLMQRTTLTPDEKIRVLRAFEVAAIADAERRRSRDQEAGARRADQADAGGAAGRARGWRAPTAPVPAAPCAQYLLAHHLAKVLAYTGEPDVDRQDPRDRAEGRRGSAGPDRLDVLAA